MMSSGSGGNSSGTLPPMQYPTSNSDVSSGNNMNMYALHEHNDYDDSKSGNFWQLKKYMFLPGYFIIG